VQSDPLVTDHAVLGTREYPFQREAAYIALAEQGMGSDELALIGTALAKGWPVGLARLQGRTRAQDQRQILPAKRGRPFKARPPMRTGRRRHRGKLSAGTCTGARRRSSRRLSIRRTRLASAVAGRYTCTHVKINHPAPGLALAVGTAPAP
jgi:hypothetical protein